MYRDNEYASAGHKPVYDKAHFIAKFSAIPDDMWCIGAIVNSRGQRCALGHLGGVKTEEAEALGLLFNACLPRVGMEIVARANDGHGAGHTPKARVLELLGQLPDPEPDPVTTDIRTKVGVEQVRILTKEPLYINETPTYNSNTFATSWSEKSHTLTVNTKFWNPSVFS